MTSPAATDQATARLGRSEQFYLTCKPLTRFATAIDRTAYRRLPDDWLIGVSDVVNSTEAIAAGRYKAVNMVGASVISAVRNGLRGGRFPFVFGGDGSAFAIAGAEAAVAANALAACRRWAGEEFDLQLRASLVPLSALRDAGFDVEVARYCPAPAVSYAMFRGDGVAAAERLMKAGEHTVAMAPAGARPDLAGLSCRWAPIRARNGAMVSLIVLPGDVDDDGFATLIGDILAIIADQPDSARPVADDGPQFAITPAGIDLEARTSSPAGGRWKRRVAIAGVMAFAWLLGRTGWRYRGFDPLHYRRQTALNTDYRKIDDGLKMTLDCTPDTVERLAARLARAHGEGQCFYGLHSQPDALMTCIVPSPFDDDHMHFVDGANGGYTAAAIALKAQIATAR